MKDKVFIVFVMIITLSERVGYKDGNVYVGEIVSGQRNGQERF